MSYLTIYTASAGSGKTFTLAAKYTAFLLSGDEEAHRRLLAVTFTNKATGEMKERILEKLYGIAYGQDPNDGFLKLVIENLPEPERSMGVTLLRERAKVRLSQLIHDYDHFAVETIDAFFQALLANLAHELGLAANFRIEVDDKEVIARAVDNLMKRISGAVEDLDAHNRALRHWISRFIEQRLDDNYSWKINDDVKGFARQLYADAYQLNKKSLEAFLKDNKSMREYEQRLREEERRIINDIRQEAEKVDAYIISHGDDPTNRDECYNKAFGTKNGYRWLQPTILSLKNGQIDINPSNSLLTFANSDKPAAPVVKDLLDKVIQDKYTYNSLHLSRTNINKLRLLSEIDHEIDCINEEENHFMLADTPRLLERMIGESDAPFVMERMGNRFEHVMIDEFQDTSPLQWKNFETLLINNTAQGHECLIVGDIKQAIYRFRGGDSHKLTELSAANRKTTHNLGRNFRSAEQVVLFNNALFTQVADSIGLDWATDAWQDTNRQKGGYVRIALTDGKDEEWSLEEDIAREIRLIMKEQQIPLSKIAVLLRNNKDANDLIDYFRLNHPDLTMVSSEAFLLSSSHCVQKLIAALRYLNERGSDHHDAISQAYLLRDADLPADFTEHEKELASMPLYELCEAIIKIFALSDVAGEAPFIFFFLDQVMEYLEEHTSSLRDFIHYWDEFLCKKSIPGGEVDGIRILTIHKSKGLAFHTVLIPYCNLKYEEDRTKDTVLWCDTKGEPIISELPVLPISPTKEMEDSIYKEEYLADHLSQITENLNLLYVAFTRAEHNLLVWSEVGGTTLTSGAVLQKALPSLQLPEGLAHSTTEGEHLTTYTYGDVAPVEDENRENEEEQNPLCYKPNPEPIAFNNSHAKLKFRQSTMARDFIKSLTDYDEQREAYRVQGILLHEALSRIITTEDIDRALQSMLAEGLITPQWIKAHRDFLVNRVKSAHAHEWFSPHWRVFNEQAIICPHQTRGMLTTCRPDRVITDGQRTIVIDFKFARHDSNHLNQVKRYCQLLREMGHPAVEGYLWYVYNDEVVPVTSPTLS